MMRLVLLAILISGVWCAKASALDLGTHGPLFEVEEPSVFELIQTRLREKEADGSVDALRDEMQGKTRSYVTRPRSVEGLGKAEVDEVWTVDLSITLTEDLADHRGVVFAKAGTRINPLGYSRFQKRIILFDGDDEAEVEFALREGNELDTLLVLVSGAPLELMRAHGRRFYFDQDAVLTSRFLVEKTPAVIERMDLLMRVSQIAVPRQTGETR